MVRAYAANSKLMYIAIIIIMWKICECPNAPIMSLISQWWQLLNLLSRFVGEYSGNFHIPYWRLNKITSLFNERCHYLSIKDNVTGESLCRHVYVCHFKVMMLVDTECSQFVWLAAVTPPGNFILYKILLMTIKILRLSLVSRIQQISLHTFCGQNYGVYVPSALNHLAKVYIYINQPAHNIVRLETSVNCP